MTPTRARTPEPPLTAAAVADLIAGYGIRWRNEDDLQARIAELLGRARVAARREVRLPGRGRIDLLADRVGIEVKVSRTISTGVVLAQLQRYAGSDQVDELLLVTVRAGHATLPAAVGGKPLRVLVLRGIG